jgi:DNA-binding NarL/FixJ family response regulator
VAASRSAYAVRTDCCDSDPSRPAGVVEAASTRGVDGATNRFVDDDEKLGELLRVNFELDERFELVGSARNGLEGVRVVSEAQPDAVLMDLHMPLLGGIAATRRIVEADPRACVIAFTASRDTAEHDAARRAGAAAVLAKPFDPVAFLDAFEGHARRCTSRRADAD